MNLVLINGSPRKGNTYGVAQKFIQEIRQSEKVQVREFFLPADMPYFCTGCYACIFKGEKDCPHAKWMQPLIDAMLEADALILTTPVYVMAESGGMKAFLDHTAYLFLIHRPHPEMFRKKAYVFSTTAGAGTRQATASVARCLRYWGVNRVYRKGYVLYALRWDQLAEKKRNAYEKDIRKRAQKFRRSVSKGAGTPTLFTRMMFFVCRTLQKQKPEDSIDRQYWKNQSWLDGKSPFTF